MGNEILFFITTFCITAKTLKNLYLVETIRIKNYKFGVGSREFNIEKYCKVPQGLSVDKSHKYTYIFQEKNILVTLYNTAKPIKALFCFMKYINMHSNREHNMNCRMFSLNFRPIKKKIVSAKIQLATAIFWTTSVPFRKSTHPL